MSYALNKKATLDSSKVAFFVENQQNTEGGLFLEFNAKRQQEVVENVSICHFLLNICLTFDNFVGRIILFLRPSLPA